LGPEGTETHMLNRLFNVSFKLLQNFSIDS